MRMQHPSITNSNANMNEKDPQENDFTNYQGRKDLTPLNLSVIRPDSIELDISVLNRTDFTEYSSAPIRKPSSDDNERRKVLKNKNQRSKE